MAVKKKTTKAIAKTKKKKTTSKSLPGKGLLKKAGKSVESYHKRLRDI